MPERLEYKCGNGHLVLSVVSITTCPAMVHGKSCLGELKRIGKGSRQASRS